MRNILIGLTVGALMAAITPVASANEVHIIGVTATNNAGKWDFAVTLKHADEGWDHYANLWQVETENGQVLGERVLLHPHVDEQPFTRSLGGVEVPARADKVYVRARDSVHGWSPQRFEVPLR